MGASFTRRRSVALVLGGLAVLTRRILEVDGRSRLRMFALAGVGSRSGWLLQSREQTRTWLNRSSGGCRLRGGGEGSVD